MGWLSDIGNFVAPVAKFATGGLINPNSAIDSAKKIGKEIEDYIPGVGDAKAQQSANAHNIELDRMNREWMERMSNSAYQRAMPDMKAAGLNPMLAFQQGGASVPNTSAPTVNAAPKTGLASAGLQAFTGIGGLNVQKTQAATAQAAQASTASLQTAQTAETMASTAKAQAETAEVAQKIKNHKLDRHLKENTSQIELLKNRAGKIGNEAADIFEAWVKGEATKGVDKLKDIFLKNSAKSKAQETQSVRRFKSTPQIQSVRRFKPTPRIEYNK